jgi:prephenate dehydrogenase
MDGDETLREEVRQVAILGLGLMGASLGMALLATGRGVVGYDAAPGVAERARERGAIEVAAGTVAEAVAGAQLIVLAAPVLAMRDLLGSIAPHLAPQALVTDLGSTKAQVVAWALELLPDPARFLGGHPMTGRERSGVEAAEAGLYQSCVWCLTPTAATAPQTVDRLVALIGELGARPLVLDAERHDAAVALVSHLPLVAACALVLTATDSPDWPLAGTLAAGGFRDSTRVASGDPRMARDICLTNAGPLLAALDAYIETVRGLRERIAARDHSIEEAFAAAKRERDEWIGGSG